MGRPAEGQLNLGFHPVFESWRPLLAMAIAFEKPQSSCRSRCTKRKRMTGKLQGVQLDLFSAFYRPEAPVQPKPDPERPLLDIFPEAYE